MSLTKSATRRLSLLAGSSLIAASLATVAFTSLALTPTTGFAADECTPVAPTLGNGSGPVSDDPSLNGSAADSFECSTTPLANGISYSSNGNLTVTKTNTGATIITTNGIDLVGNGADSVTWVSTLGGITGGQLASSPGPVGALIDVTTSTGPINITTAGVTANRAGTTYGIRASSGNALTSTPGGNITIDTVAGGINNNVAGGQAAISADTNGGNISITTGGGFTQGRLRGIVAQTTGAGTISITSGGDIRISATDGLVGISTVAGTGATTININGSVVQSGIGVAIRSVSAGAVTIQHSATAFTTVQGPVDFGGVAGGVTWNGGSRGSWQASGTSTFSGGADTVNLSNASLAAGGVIDFGGGADTLNLLAGNGSFTATSSTLTFGAGADRLNVASRLTATTAAINFGADADTLSITGLLDLKGTPVDFGSGADTLDLSGILFTDGVVTLSGLEAFDTAGSIYLGGRDNVVFTGTDGNADDVLRVTSGVFTGGEGSQVFMDAFLGAHASQIGCATLVAADCLDLTGASTAGSTSLLVQDVSFNINAGTLGSIVTLVEGSTAADHFILDPASSNYAETSLGPAIRKPVVAYYFQYDEANQRHVLVGAPTDEPFQVGTFATSAQETWRATTGSWLTRQADLRATPGGLAPSLGVWGRISGQAGEREAAASYSTGGVSLDFDLSQKQRIAHLNFGADVIGGAGWVVGATVGFVRSDVEFEATPTEATLTGFSGGLYASYVAGPLFVDGLFNTNILHMKADAPQMGIGPEVPMKFDLKSLGGQVEAGWRFGMDSGLFIEPLVGASYVVTLFDDAEVPGGSGLFEFDETKSLRLGGGARVGLDGELMGMAAGYSLTGRYWNDSEGGSSATITTASGSSAVLADEFGGGFSEVVASVNLYGEDGGVSGFLNLGGKFGDDYQAVDGSAGVRVRW